MVVEWLQNSQKMKKISKIWRKIAKSGRKPVKKKCAENSTLGGGLAGHFPHLKKTNVFKMHLSHFKPIKTMFFSPYFFEKKIEIVHTFVHRGGRGRP